MGALWTRDYYARILIDRANARTNLVLPVTTWFCCKRSDHTAGKQVSILDREPLKVWTPSVNR